MARKQVYLFYRGQWLEYLTMLLLFALGFLMNSIVAISIVLLAGLVGIILLKRYTSFRFYPLFMTLRMDEHYVQKEFLILIPFGSIWFERVSLDEIYISEAKYHGLRYVILSASPIQDTNWKAVAKNQDAIVYPFHHDMKWDFPELFGDFSLTSKK